MQDANITQTLNSRDSLKEVSIKNGQTLPVFGNTLTKVPQYKDIDLKNIRFALPNLNIDQMKILALESKL